MAEAVPKVGVGVMILKDGKVLLAKRKNAHGAGEYAFPGGHLEFGESFVQCAIRETCEESGIEIEDIQFQYLANVKKYAGKHYVHIGLTARWKSGKPQVLEPDKSGAWRWYGLDDLPSPMFEMCRLAIQSYKTKQRFFDS
jgi:8-oxo-dGTP diphosphatase